MRTIAIGRKAFLFVGSERADPAAAIYYSLVETCLCRMRHRHVHAERPTMPNEVRSMRANTYTCCFALVEGIISTRHSLAPHRAWRKCSKRSGGRYRPLGRPFIAGTFANAASFNAI
jgi:transposase